MSCTKPGSVISADRTPPPGVDADSSTQTERPAWARRMAAASPLGPEPTTMASVLGSSWLGVRFLAELLAGLLASFMAGSRCEDVDCSTLMLPKWLTQSGL